MRNGESSEGVILKRTDFPDYFKHIHEERILASDDAQNDNRTLDFVESYLKPLNVFSRLDSSIFSDGEMIGVVIFEQQNKSRKWDFLDKNFAASFSDFIGRLIESEKRHIYERELRHRINYLENDLKKKLFDLNEAKLSLDTALEAAQVGKWDWNIVTGKVSLNKTWYTKLGYQNQELPQTFETSTPQQSPAMYATSTTSTVSAPSAPQLHQHRA